MHRTDGPAVEQADGSKQWYLKGKLVNGWHEWFLNGVEQRSPAMTDIQLLKVTELLNQHGDLIVETGTRQFRFCALVRIRPIYLNR
jgi:hypothetical protein